MSLVGTGGWENGHPYAFGYDEAKVVHLGTPIAPILGRLPHFVNLDMARSEGVPVDAHRALELTLALLSTELSNQKEGTFDSVAIACLVTNQYLPQEIQHPHTEILDQLHLTKKNVNNYLAHAEAKTDLALGLTAGIIQGNQELYIGESSHALQQALLRFHLILNEFGPTFNPRNIRISQTGELTRVD